MGLCVKEMVSEDEREKACVRTAMVNVGEAWVMRKEEGVLLRNL